jgi:hypothetical protein
MPAIFIFISGSGGVEEYPREALLPPECDKEKHQRNREHGDRSPKPYYFFV